jgi:LAGLIDADG endonuclease
VLSDNLDGAENQQERLISTGWVIGFVDGEGCFSIGFNRRMGRESRSDYKTGYQVSHRFAVTQGASSAVCLEDLHRFFAIGRIVRNARQDNHREDLLQYRVDRRADLTEVVIPFFREHPLRTAKRRDFEAFARCVELVSAGRHLDSEGLIEIVEISQTMNRQKPRHDLIRILRGHTPEVQDTGS